MKACVQRVTSAEVRIAGERVAAIGQGLVVLLGVAADDSDADVAWMADKICLLRVFDDESGRMNRSLADFGGGMLVVSQFTLLADISRGRRPSFTSAAEPELAEKLYESFVQRVRDQGLAVQTGRFRAMMQVTLTNDGPVTLILDSRALGAKGG